LSLKSKLGKMGKTQTKYSRLELNSSAVTGKD
jgi:hypothetical protein